MNLLDWKIVDSSSKADLELSFLCELGWLHNQFNEPQLEKRMDDRYFSQMSVLKPSCVRL